MRAHRLPQKTSVSGAHSAPVVCRISEDDPIARRGVIHAIKLAGIVVQQFQLCDGVTVIRILGVWDQRDLRRPVIVDCGDLHPVASFVLQFVEHECCGYPGRSSYRVKCSDCMVCVCYPAPFIALYAFRQFQLKTVFVLVIVFIPVFIVPSTEKIVLCSISVSPDEITDVCAVRTRKVLFDQCFVEVELKPLCRH